LESVLFFFLPLDPTRVPGFELASKAHWLRFVDITDSLWRYQRGQPSEMDFDCSNYRLTAINYVGCFDVAVNFQQTGSFSGVVSSIGPR
jgi:hypothetical protein